MSNLSTETMQELSKALVLSARLLGHAKPNDFAVNPNQYGDFLTAYRNKQQKLAEFTKAVDTFAKASGSSARSGGSKHGKKPCSFHQKGNCKKGDACKFSHASPRQSFHRCNDKAKVIIPVCREEGCNQEKCFMSHPPPNAENTGWRSMVCRRGVGCPNRGTCWNAHLEKGAKLGPQKPDEKVPTDDPTEKLVWGDDGNPDN